MCVNRRRIRKEKVADSKISRNVWTGPKYNDSNNNNDDKTVQVNIYFPRVLLKETHDFNMIVSIAEKSSAIVAIVWNHPLATVANATTTVIVVKMITEIVVSQVLSRHS